MNIEQFVDELDFDALADWAKALKVPYDKDGWLDDEYPDKEDELRVAVSEAMESQLDGVLNIQKGN